MLTRLSVKNFILIDQLDIDFAKGLCAITGETGAGKSILIDSLLFCLGGKFNNSVIKANADFTIVTAEFQLRSDVAAILDTHDIEYENSLFIKRSQNIKGQKKFYLNDVLVTSKLVGLVANLLLDYHGQNQHNYLENSNTHSKILDDFADNEFLLQQTNQNYKIWQAFVQELNEIMLKRAQIESEKSYLEFVIDELTKAAITSDEEEQLSLARIALQQQEKSQQLLADALSLIENQTFESKILQTQKILAKLPEKFNQVAELLDQSVVYYSEAKDLLHSYAYNNDSGYNNLDEVEERLFFIKALARKYNVHSNELVNLLTTSQQRLTELSIKLENGDLLHIKVAKAQAEFINTAQQLSISRAYHATILQQRINAELQYLKMAKAEFKVDIKPLNIAAARSNGLDEIRFMASTNPGTPLSPIDKIASGGELSRLMLALKIASYPVTNSNIQTADTVIPCMIFDEIDTGLGGMVASLVGDRLKKLAGFGQVIVITHQPQVAGLADQHILIQKQQTTAETSVKIQVLDHNDSLLEVARMLSGKEITEASIKAAAELMIR